MKITVFGAGRMGRPVMYALTELGHEVYGVETSPSELSKAQKQQKKFNHNYHLTSVAHFENDTVSCLPYSLNKDLAKKCIDSGLAYFGLGGHLETSQFINIYAKEHNGTVFTDLGLAPGLVNILGESIVEEYDTLEMYCGGLPQNPNLNPLRYSLTWSVDGLVNEYQGKCLVKINGFLSEEDAMEGYKFVWVNGDRYEAFYTSGALHNFTSFDKVKNVSYRTLRYTGHRYLIKWLMSNLTDIELKSLIQNGCPQSDDKVVIMCLAGDKITRNKIIYTFLPQSGFSAMQVATGFSLAAVVNQGANGVMKYSDVNVEQLKKDLNTMGVNL